MVYHKWSHSHWQHVYDICVLYIHWTNCKFSQRTASSSFPHWVVCENVCTKSSTKITEDYSKYSHLKACKNALYGLYSSNVYDFVDADVDGCLWGTCFSLDIESIERTKFDEMEKNHSFILTNEISPNRVCRRYAWIQLLMMEIVKITLISEHFTQQLRLYARGHREREMRWTRFENAEYILHSNAVMSSNFIFLYRSNKSTNLRLNKLHKSAPSRFIIHSSIINWFWQCSAMHLRTK